MTLFMLLLVALVATPGTSEAELQSVAAPTHCREFAIFDTMNFGGRYISGLPDCHQATRPGQMECSTNGHVRVDQHTIGTSFGKCFYHGPALDETWIPIPGTEDDVVVVTTALSGWPIPGSFDVMATTVEITIEGSSILFSDGEPLDGLVLTFALEDEQTYGIIGVVDPSETGGTFDVFWGLTGGFEFGRATYWESIESFPREFVPIPAPEPAIAVSLAVGVLALAFRGRRCSSI